MADSDVQFEVIVIGAGIMGSATAYEAAKRGQNTILLEKFDFLHHLGSSHGESRTLRATYPEEYYSSMVIKSAQLWEEAEAQIGFGVYFKAPQFDMGPSDNKSLLSVIDNCQRNGISHRVLDARQVFDEFTGRIVVPENWVGLVTEMGGVIKPTKAVYMFQALAFKNGCSLKDNSEVVDIRRDSVRGGILVYTAKGETFWCKKCVVTVGAWMQKLIKQVSGVVLPIQPLETCVCYWKIKNDHAMKFTIESGFPSFASYGVPYIYGTPSLEFPGLLKIPVHGGRNCDPDDRKWAVSSAALEALKEWIDGRFGGLVDSTGPVSTQSCLYSMTPDEDFVIDFLGGEFGNDIVVAGGFSGHGFKMGPLIGKVLADLVIDGETKDVELSHFKLGRFEGNPKGNLKEFEDQVNALFY